MRKGRRQPQGALLSSDEHVQCSRNAVGGASSQVSLVPTDLIVDTPIVLHHSDASREIRCCLAGRKHSNVFHMLCEGRFGQDAARNEGTGWSYAEITVGRGKPIRRPLLIVG
jgi:hypothetical protein